MVKKEKNEGRTIRYKLAMSHLNLANSTKRCNDSSWNPLQNWSKTRPLQIAVATGGALGYYLGEASKVQGGAATLTYFCGRGKAETTRWMLAATGVKFCNSGLRTHKEFVDLKEKQGKLLFGQLPILELDNHVFTQSASMVEYLAKRANLCGKDLFEETRCSEIAGAVRDWAQGPMAVAFQEDKGAYKRGHCTTLFKKFGDYMEKILKENPSGFMVGENVTYADILVAECLTSYEEMIPGIIDSFQYERLKMLKNVVCSLPSLKEYLNSPLRYDFPDDTYVTNVRAVLGQPLPPHLKRNGENP